MFRKVGSALLAVMAVLVIVGVGGFVLASATGIDLNHSSGSHARLADEDLVQAPEADGSGFVPSAPAFTADSPPTAAIVGTPYTYTFAASGSPAPTFSVNSGSLPSGLILDSTTGTLSGTPTKAGGFTFKVEAANGVTPAAVSPSITITVTAQTICARRATIPAGYVVTALVPNWPSCGADNLAGFNAYQLSKVAAGDVICWGTEFEPAEPVPAGYVPTAMLDASQCGRGTNLAGFNAYQISAVAAGDIICWGTEFEPAEPVPAGYVATAMLDASQCGRGTNLGRFNAYQISKVAAGDVICWGTELEPAEPVPAGYVATAMLNAPQCGRGTNLAGFNAYRISAVAAGDVICWGTAFEPVEPVPAGYVKSATLDAPQCGRGTNFAGVNAYRISAS